MMRVSTAGLIMTVLFAITGQANAYDYYQPLPAAPEYPADNQPTRAKINLGKQLFFDRRMSKSGRFYCNDCHDVMSTGADGQARSIGDAGKATKRSAPTLWNVAYQSVYFWDGRAKSLESALEEHLFDFDIMGMTSSHVLIKRLSAIEGYKKQFQSVFRRPIHIEDVKKAIASYIRTLITPHSPYDRYLRGEKNAMSDQAIKGMKVFHESECIACHFGPNMSGPAPGPALKMGDGFYELFPNFRGTRYEQSMNLLADQGRFHVTGDPGHKLMWRVPSLRNIAITAPYFHNGSAETLEKAVEVMAATQRQRKLSADEIQAIVAFLNSLTGEFPRQSMPALPLTPNKSLY